MKNLIVLIFAAIMISCSGKQEDGPRKSTRSENVVILEKPFIIKGLDRERTIRLYLPEDYANSSESYPVIYGHDGQNLFDDSTSYAGEWALDESLNTIAKETGFKLIVVGIDNGLGKRMNELSPWENKRFGSAEGKEYMDFIVQQIKPYMDSTYRTLPDRENTAIMGSSMGGLISHYGIYQYPEIFSKAIIFSPSYWYADEVWDFTTSQPLPKDSRLWLEIGEKEGDAVDDTNKMYEVILETGHPQDQVVKKVDPQGEHNEASWRRQFVPAIKWLFDI